MTGISHSVVHLQNKTRRLLETWRENMTAFVEQVILEPYNSATGSSFYMTRQQKEASEALSKLALEKECGRSRDKLGISIMSGKGTGKDAWVSWAIFWFMTCFSYPKIPCISVSADQLNKVLWSELSKWMMHSPYLKQMFTLQNDKLFCHTVPSEVRGKRWMAFPKAANPKDSKDEQVEGLAGIHEKNLLQVIDEGSGVLDPVFETLEGNMTGEINIILLIFNPTRSKGYAIDTQYKNSDRWITLNWNAEESELVSKESIEALKQKNGRDSNPYRIRVLGLPPITDEQTMFPWDWLEDAVDRPFEVNDNVPLIKGVDCGAGGDASIIATRRGPIVYNFKKFSTQDSTILANWIGTNIDADKPDVVRIDTIGIGWAVEGMLREKKGSIIEAADSRKVSDEPLRFYNKRSEMYWRLRTAFEKNAISIPNDQELINALGATRCEYTSQKGSSVIKVVEKKKIKQEIGHSPDEADALALTYYYPDEMVSTKHNFRKRSFWGQLGVDKSFMEYSWLGA